MIKYAEMLIDWNKIKQLMENKNVGDSFTFETKFKDNVKAILTCSIINTKLGPDLYVEASLFDKNGCECDCLESNNVSDILGTWQFVNEFIPYKIYNVKIITNEHKLVGDYDRE